MVTQELTQDFERLKISDGERKNAWRIGPHDPEALFGLGQAYEKLGECIKAIDCYQRYVDLALPEKRQKNVAEYRIQYLCKVIRAVYSF